MEYIHQYFVLEDSGKYQLTKIAIPPLQSKKSGDVPMDVFSVCFMRFSRDNDWGKNRPAPSLGDGFRGLKIATRASGSWQETPSSPVRRMRVTSASTAAGWMGRMGMGMKSW